jgi:hypothetical protein
MNNNSDIPYPEEEEYISIDKIIENQPVNNNTVFNFSNFNDVIIEDTINNKNTDNTDNYLYQPQFKDNICNLQIVGYDKQNKKPEIKMGEFKLLNDKWLIISHLYNITELNNIYEFKNRYIDIFSIVLNKVSNKVLNKVLNKDNPDIILSLRYIVNNNIEKYKFNGKFLIIFRYKKSNENEKLLKIKDINNFPGFNKSIEILIKELSNPIIIDKYDKDY